MPTSSTRPVVLVTGAARRLGRAIAIELARAGYDIALHYRSSGADCQASAAYVRALGVRGECFQANLADEAQCRTLLPAVAAQLGRSSTVDDVAQAVRFVIESPAITGTTIVVDGGQHLAAQPRDVAFLTPRQ